jgi:hypothetical protein
MRVKMKRPIIIILIVFILGLGIISVTASASRASDSYPKVSIALFETSKIAQVSPSEPSEVVFECKLNVEFPKGYENPSAYVNVSLNVVDTWGNSTLSQKYFIFKDDAEQLLNATVIVPPCISYNNPGKVIILGKWFMEPIGFQGNVNPQRGVEGRVNIKQYHNFTISCPQTKMTADIFEEKKFELQIKNTGNFMDVFQVEILNEEELSDKCINVYQTQYNLEIFDNRTETVKIISRPTDTTKCLGNHKIKVRVHSPRGEPDGVEPQDITFELEVPQEQMINTVEFQNCFIVIIIVVIFVVFITWRRRQRKKKDVVRC